MATTCKLRNRWKMYVINLVVLFGMHTLETSCTHHHVKVKKKMDNEMGEPFRVDRCFWTMHDLYVENGKPSHFVLHVP